MRSRWQERGPVVADAIGAWLKAVLSPPRPTPPLNEQGVYEVGSPAFRRVCAISERGIYRFVRDRHDRTIAEELQDLQKQFALPREQERRSATVAEISHLNGLSSPSDGAPPTAGARRILRMIAEAAAQKASDFKLTIRADHADLRLKLGAEEYTHGAQWDVSEAEEAIAFLFDRRDYGDGASAQQSGKHQAFSIGQERRIDLPPSVAAMRFQKAPHGDGHDFLVGRLIYTTADEDAGHMEDLGLDDDVLQALEEERVSKSGLVIIGGSTGSGKSTTLVRQLERLYQDRGGRISIMTIEDPIEYPIAGDGIIQMAVEGGSEGAARRAAFTRVLMTFVRSNPDVGMVSEIRSADDCREIMQFVVSGHKVLTTIHSNSANGVLFRLIRLGVDPKEVAEPGVISLVLRQELVPILCPHCAKPADGTAREIIADWCGLPEATPMLRNRDGCPDCLAGRDDETSRVAWAGLSRKRATAEFIKVDNTYRGFVEARDALGAEAYWLRPKAEGGLGGITVEQRLRRLVAAGQVDFEDVTHRSLDQEIAKTRGGPQLVVIADGEEGTC